MEQKYYSSERSVQILISLLRQHNIKRVIASPGTTNLPFVGSLMHDSWFEMYSSVDERSAAYIACGLAAETGEPVVLSCTGATASRNYLPGLTEAYYRKLPVLAITSTQNINKIGHHIAQVIDRRERQNDVVLLSEYIPATLNDDDAWSNMVRINRAILELTHRGGGPVHINLMTQYNRDYSVEMLPEARKISRISLYDEFPPMPKGRVSVFVGSHRKFTEQETELLDSFCAEKDAVVFVDHTSGYYGKYRVPIVLSTSQEHVECHLVETDLLIHIGEVSGAYISLKPREVWRVSPDGELRDTYRKLSTVFEMPEDLFFQHYVTERTSGRTSYLEQCQEELDALRRKLSADVLPFSNIWIASQTAHRLPDNSVLHLGILNSLRSWNLFDTPASVTSYSNTGGFGIDGDVSSLIGASLAHPDHLYFGVLGDLAFFYDMNVIGNRHVGNNVRILLINNGKGTEFRNYNHPGSAFGEDADKYIAAGGHFGNKSHELIKHYAEDLGYEYLSAYDKDDYLQKVERFLIPEITDRPMIFEVFTDSVDESDALRTVYNLEMSASSVLKGAAKKILGQKGVKLVKNIIK